VTQKDNVPTLGIVVSRAITRHQDSIEQALRLVRLHQRRVRLMSEEEIKEDIKTLKQKIVGFYQNSIPAKLRPTFWILFIIVCLVVATVIRLVVPGI
jgi:hypothetical protein